MAIQNIENYQAAEGVFETTVIPFLNRVAVWLETGNVRSRIETGAPDVKLTDGSTQTYIQDLTFEVKVSNPPTVSKLHIETFPQAEVGHPIAANVTCDYPGGIEVSEIDDFLRITEDDIRRYVREFLAEFEIYLPDQF